MTATVFVNYSQFLDEATQGTVFSAPDRLDRLRTDIRLWLRDCVPADSCAPELAAIALHAGELSVVSERRTVISEFFDLCPPCARAADIFRHLGD